MSMDAAFSAAIDANYRVHGNPATYSPRDGASLTVTVIDGVEPAPSAFESGARQTDVTLSVRVSEVSEPARGDTVTLEDGTCHKIMDAYAINKWEWGLIVR